MFDALIFLSHLDAGIEAGDHNFTKSAVGSSHFWSSNSNGLNLNLNI